MRIYLLAFIIASACLHVYAGGYSQVSVQQKQITLPALFSDLKKQTGYSFFYNNAEIKHIGKIDVAVSNATLEHALSQIFADLPVTYQIINKTVVIKRKDKAVVNEATIPTDPAYPQLADVTGVVTDTLGLPLKGATVSLVSAKRSVLTDDKGFFILRNVPDGSKIRISFVGYQDKELVVTGSGHLNIVLLTKTQALDIVTVNAGILRRNRETFTGATTTFSGEELRKVGNLNIIQSLKALDPSFVVLENNAIGSNPNALPNIELRGKTSITTTQLNDQFSLDPNLPLFVLDGFESKLETIFNLDINRVASITILKDAASTAIYGSRAANGVVVVETFKPQPGELRLSYAAGSNINVPDFRSYNLMNAAEKLEFERLSGRYNDVMIDNLYNLKGLYNSRLAEVKRGVNTYWLSEPVRTGISSNHNLSLMGGNEELSFYSQVTLRNEAGVMKGSGKRTWGGSVGLTYRRGRLNITNTLYISGVAGTESPYGAFSEFANTNPYYRKYREDGQLIRRLDSVESSHYGKFYNPNPLYNASLNNINKSDGFDVQNGLQGYWDVNNRLRVSGGLQLAKNTTIQTRFFPPEHTMFDNADVLLKGSYENNRTEQLSYDGNLALTYAAVFGRHQLASDFRVRANEVTSRLIGFSAVGFPLGTNGNPAFAYDYTPFSSPTAATQRSRGISALTSASYSFDQRYLLDLTYSTDGSSNFGSNKLFKPFWSVGVGWNLHHEKWLRNEWLSTLRLRANTGVTGNQNLGLYTSSSVYTYYPSSDPFGQSLNLTSLGNPDLDWQTSIDNSYGIDFGLFDGIIGGQINYFNRVTDPLLINISEVFPASTGITSDYPVNVGKLTTSGWEAYLTLRLLSNTEKRINWMVSVNGTFNTNSRYSKFGNALKALNDAQLNSQGLIRYHDGYSPDDLWAVESRGIDPATGREIFLKKDGRETFVYSTDDIVRIGNGLPTAYGNMNSSFTYGAFSAFISLEYSFGGYRYNQTLYDKVENINMASLLVNQDRRALYDRWQKPGDVAQFRAVQLAGSSVVPVTSRFIQRDNYLVGNSVNISWRFSQVAWLQSARIRSLRAGITMNDLFRQESIRFERGTSYPFQRTVTLSLSVNF